MLTEMDGTLLDASRNILADRFKVFHQVNHQKIHFVIASGRSYYALNSFFEPYSDELDVICDNGAYIKSHYLPPQSSPLTDQLESPLKIGKTISNCNVILSGSNEMYATPYHQRFKKILAAYFLNLSVMDDLAHVTDSIHRICICDLNNPTTLFHSYQHYNLRLLKSLYRAIFNSISPTKKWTKGLPFNNDSTY